MSIFEKFNHLSKYSFEETYFKKISAEAPIIYELLKGHFEIFLQNECVDKNNNIYFISEINIYANTIMMLNSKKHTLCM